MRVLVGERLQIGRIGTGPAKDLAKQHDHDHRAHQRKGMKARITGRHLAAVQWEPGREAKMGALEELDEQGALQPEREGTEHATQ